MTLSRRILSILALSLFTVGLWAQETGKADIFSDEFQGSWTASKTTYNKDEFVAAHKSYEFGTILKVMIGGADKAINVRVVDRGPFKFGYVVTLSKAAANELGLKEDDQRDVTIFVAKEQGLATVAPTTNTQIVNQTSVVSTPQPTSQTQVITTTTAPTTTIISQPSQEFITKGQATNVEVGNEYTTVVTKPTATVVTKPTETVVMTETITSSPSIVTSSNIGFGLQVGSFIDYNNAMLEMTTLQNKNINNLLLNAVNDASGKTVYKLVIGPFADRIEVEQYKALDSQKYNNQAFIVDLSKLK